jgi:23S rRNA pseudouridine1911/1915/1917 synthase
MSELFTIIITEESAGQRLDKVLTTQCVDLSRAFIQKLFDEGRIYKKDDPDAKIKPSKKVTAGDIYAYHIPPLKEANPTPDSSIPLDIVYEDEDLVVINKQAGLVVHPGAGHWEGTLVHALLHHCHGSLSGIGGVKRPGIVHRLDKDTSGLMIVAKNDQAHQFLSHQFENRTLSRVYHALVWGQILPPKGIIDTFITRSPRNRQKMAVCDSSQGKPAVTHYSTLKSFIKEDLSTSVSLVECRLKTGRTHQIRVHMHHIGHPLLGDPLYGKCPKGAKKVWGEDHSFMWFPHQALQAVEIQFIHPRKKELMIFTIPSKFKE